MANTDIWMPLYGGDYLRDTMSLSTEEHGCYLLLLIYYWTEKQLLDDLNELMLVTRLRPEQRGVLEKILRKYFEHQDGHYTQKRMEGEIQRAQNIRNRNRQNAAARWDNAKPVPGECQTDAKRVPNRCPPQSQSQSQPKPIRHRYGLNKRVLLTDANYSDLCDRYGKPLTDDYIQRVDDYCENHNQTYSNWTNTVHTWIRNDVKAGKLKLAPPKKKKVCPECGVEYIGSSCKCGWSQ